MDLAAQLTNTSEMWAKMLEKQRNHNQKRRKCTHLDWAFHSDWVTCLHPDNPTELQVCSHHHCPIKEE